MYLLKTILGWEILYSWFTDALLAKNGIVKVWWDDYDDSVREEYTHLDDMEFNILISNDDVEILEHSPYEEDDGIYHDVVFLGKGKLEELE